MKTFKQYLLTEAAPNLHLEHLEDEIFNGGVIGTRGAINFLRSLRDMLAGHAKRPVNVTVKWDGAPAIYAGQHPDTGKFFVATKGLFNKEPKFATTEEEVDQLYHQGLAPILKVALRLFSKLGIKGIWQGDIMFTRDSLSTQIIAGEKYITFQPNTIVYAVPIRSQLARDISRAEIGVVWHTTYSGRSLDNLSAKFGADVRKLKNVPGVWQRDAGFQDESGVATFTAAETQSITAKLSEAGRLFNKIDGRLMDAIANDKEMRMLVKTFNNSRIRVGEPVGDPKKYGTLLQKWLHDRMEKNIGSVKTDAAKERKRKQGQRWLEYIDTHWDQFVLIFTLYNTIISAKLQIIRKLETIKQMDMFIKTTDGFKVTAPEGFVAVDHVGNAVKLIDRLTFSMNNFNVVKNWDK